MFTSFRVEEYNLILRSENEVLPRQTVNDGFQRGRQILKYILLTPQTTLCMPTIQYGVHIIHHEIPHFLLPLEVLPATLKMLSFRRMKFL